MRRRLRPLLLIAVLFGATVSCSWFQRDNSGPQVTLPPNQPSNVSPGSTGNGSAGGNTTAAPPANGQPGATQAPGGVPLTLQVTSPQDGAVVNTAQVVITGTSTPGAVVTVDQDIIVVGADGQFQSTVSLDQGPNIIEIVASDDLGNEKTIDLTIDYEP